MKIFILLVVHLISVLLYTACPDSVKYSADILFKSVSYEGAFSAWYFGTEALFAGAFLYLAQSNKNLLIEKQLINVEIGMWLTRGFLYVFDNLKIYDSNTKERLIVIALSVLIPTIIIGYSANRYGFLRK